MKSIMLGVGGGLVLAAGSITMASTLSERAKESAQEVAAVQLRAGCGRTQRLNAYLQLRALEFKNGDIAKSRTTRLAPYVFPIVWCEKTFAPGYTGPAVMLPKKDAVCFMRLVAHGYFNQLRAPGQSVGVHQPFTDPSRLRAACARTTFPGWSAGS